MYALKRSKGAAAVGGGANMAANDTFHYEVESHNWPPRRSVIPVEAMSPPLSAMAVWWLRPAIGFKRSSSTRRFRAGSHRSERRTVPDSSGLGALVRLKFSAAKESSVSVTLVNIAPRVMQLLRITNLAEWFAS